MKTEKMENVIETKVSLRNEKYRVQIVQLGAYSFYTRVVITGNNGKDINMQYDGKSYCKAGYASISALKKHSQRWKNF